MTDDLFQNQLSNFPVLDQLTLSKCYTLECITISCHWLKRLVLRACNGLREADIDTPNLLSFEYKGCKMPFSSLNPCGLKEAKLYFELCGLHSTDNREFCYHKLCDFLGKFDQSKGLKLVVRSQKSMKDIIIHGNLRETLVPQKSNLSDLKLEIIKASTNLEDVLDNLLRAWYPETLSIVSCTSDLPEQVYKRMLDREEEPSCCKYNTANKKCWRHFLIDVNIENLDDSENKSVWIGWFK